MAEAVLRLRTRRALWHRDLVVGGALLAAFLALAVLSERIAPYDPAAQDLLALLDPPSASHWFGTDQVGRDVFSRLLAGTRITLAVALAAVAAAGAIGVSLGLLAGYFGGWVDRAITVVVDLLLTVPNLVLAIAIIAAVGASAVGLTVAMTVSFVPPLARLVRGRALELREEDFISAARTLGLGDGAILVRHVLPNALSVVVIELSLLAGQAVLVASALGFLGLGVQPPAPEWGAMLGAAREYLSVAPALVVAPGLAISLLVFAFNAFGDGLRDHLDPRARS